MCLAGRVLVGAGLGVLVAFHDGDAVERAVAVHEVLATARAGVGNVGQVGERDVTEVGGHRATGQGGVPVVVVPGTEALGLVVVGVGAVRGDDHVLGEPVRRGGGVAEVRGRVDRLDTELVAAGGRGRGRALIDPHAGQRAAGRVADVLGVARRAGLRAGRDAVAILGQHTGPEFTAGAQALHKLLHIGGQAVRVTGQCHVAVAVGALGAPLGAIEDQVNLLRAGGDADPVDAPAIVEVVGRRVHRMVRCPPFHQPQPGDGRNSTMPVRVVIRRRVRVDDGRGVVDRGCRTSCHGHLHSGGDGHGCECGGAAAHGPSTERGAGSHRALSYRERRAALPGKACPGIWHAG